MKSGIKFVREQKSFRGSEPFKSGKLKENIFFEYTRTKGSAKPRSKKQILGRVRKEITKRLRIINS